MTDPYYQLGYANDTKRIWRSVSPKRIVPALTKIDQLLFALAFCKPSSVKSASLESDVMSSKMVLLSLLESHFSSIFSLLSASKCTRNASVVAVSCDLKKLQVDLVQILQSVCKSLTAVSSSNSLVKMSITVSRFCLGRIA
jgi:hypothetical protein